MSEPKCTNIRDLQEYGEAFQDWFKDFNERLEKTPLVLRECEKIGNIFDRCDDLLGEVCRILQRAREWDGVNIDDEKAKEHTPNETTRSETRFLRRKKN